MAQLDTVRTNVRNLAKLNGATLLKNNEDELRQKGYNINKTNNAILYGASQSAGMYWVMFINAIGLQYSHEDNHEYKLIYSVQIWLKANDRDLYAFSVTRQLSSPPDKNVTQKMGKQLRVLVDDYCKSIGINSTIDKNAMNIQSEIL